MSDTLLWGGFIALQLVAILLHVYTALIFRRLTRPATPASDPVALAMAASMPASTQDPRVLAARVPRDPDGGIRTLRSGRQPIGL